MVSPIPNFVKRLWDKWDTRGVVLSSLSLQIILILVAPLRKRTSNRYAVFLLWSAYLLADVAANFCIGLICNGKDNSTSSSTSNTTAGTAAVIDNLMAFWAPFLLLHLGGPDTITAFALQDNELWLRHLLGVIVQVGAVIYIFLLTVPGNTLWIPTVLIFIAGIIKYTERTRALYLASMGTFRQSMVNEADAGPNYVKLMDEYSSKIQAGLPARIDVIPEPDQRHILAKQKSRSTNSSSDPEKLNDVKLVQDGYYFFSKFKGLIVDMIYSIGDRNESREYFLDEKKGEEDVLRVIEVELNFMYEFFYTKASALHCTRGYLFRLVAFSSIVAAFVLFILEEKRGFDEFDVLVTYTLLHGALALDSLALLMLFFNDRTLVVSNSSQSPQRSFPKVFDKIKDWIKSNVVKHVPRFRNYFLSFNKPVWSACKKQLYVSYWELSTPFLFRRWSGTISGLNLITYCLHSCPRQPSKTDYSLWLKATQFSKVALDGFIKYFGVGDILDKWLYKESNPFLKELWDVIFKEVRRKAIIAEDPKTTKDICDARGEWVLKEADLKSELKKELMAYVQAHKVAFDESLIQWHIATQLCYHKEENPDNYPDRKISRLLSDYMLYLLFMEPSVMSGVAGLGLKRFKDTRAEAIRFFSKRKEASSNTSKEDHEKEEISACATLLAVFTEIKPSDVKGDRSKSVLFDACILAKHLRKIEEPKERWKIIKQIWVELLLFAASNSRPATLLSQLSKGGELISLVWLLMVQMGLGMQFQIKQGHARAKLIVGRSK